MKRKKDRMRQSFLILPLFFLFCFSAYAELTLDAVYPTLGKVGEDLEVSLKGSGFNSNTRASMFLDTGNTRAIIGSVDTPGEAEGVFVVGDKAYVADGGCGLYIIDISNPTAPEIIGSVDTLRSAYGVTVLGETAYVADGSSGLHVIDISDPTAPKIIGSVDTPGIAEDLTVVDGKAYVADSYAGLQVIDISNPEAPLIIGSVNTLGHAWGVTVINGRAYVADSYAGLQVIDISNPEAPLIIGSVGTPDWALEVAVVGDKAYVADSYAGLQVIDISNPEAPLIIGSVDTPGYARGVTVVGETAYVTNHYLGIQVIDISNPTAPKIIGSVDTPGIAEDLRVVGGKAYVADSYSGLQVIDISNPTAPEAIGLVNTPDYAWRVAVVGEKACVADGGSGLQVIDVSNPTEPEIIGWVDTPGSANGVTVVGDKAYVADRNSGLQVIDVSNPTEPEIIGWVDTPGSANGVAVVGDKAYVADRNSGLQVIDVSNPTEPEIIGSVDTLNWALEVAVVGDKAYVADGSSGLQVIDISHTDAPLIIGSIYMPGVAEDVTVIGDRAYVADGGCGLYIIDISDPIAPEIIGSLGTSSALGVTVVGETAYVADADSGGLKVIDISNPEAPLIISSMGMPGFASGVTVVNSKVYVACGNAGMVITPPPVKILTGSIIVSSETEINLTLPSQSIAGHYTLRVFNETENDELRGAVSFTTDARMLASKAIIVAGGGPNAPGHIWEAIKQSANSAYSVLLHEGYDDTSIYYLTDEFDNKRRDDSSRYDPLKWAINTWAQDASELLVFFVDHGLRDHFIIHSNGDDSETLSVDELDDWLDSLQQTMSGPVTFIYDACHSGTFATKLGPPEGKDRIIITGASDEAAHFVKLGEDAFDTFSLQFWNQIDLSEGNLGHAFSEASKIMRGYDQTALINANGNNRTNEEEDYSIANTITIRRGRPIYLKPVPTIEDAVGEMTLYGDSTATIWVRNVREAESVRARIIPPHIEPEEIGGPITTQNAIELVGSDDDGTYEGTFEGFVMEGSYLVTIEAQTSQEFYNYVQDTVTTQIITSLPVYTAVTQENGTQDIIADNYEADDSHPQANIIILEDLDVQPHDFHDPEDVDWVKFFGLSGQTYTISANNLSILCDVVIELYDRDGTTLLAISENGGGAGDDEFLSWSCPQDGDGIYYVKISSANAHFGENVTYDLKIYRPLGPSLSVLVSGQVLAPDHAPVSDVRISTASGGSAISNDEGNFFIRLQEGTCTLTLVSDQYGTRTMPIDVVEGQENYHEVIFDGDDGGDGEGSGGGGGGCFLTAVAIRCPVEQ